MQLVYWGKATVIYPVCNSNLYVISPMLSSLLNSVLLDQFSEQFPGGHSLHEYLQLFSFPNSISQSLPNVSRNDEYQHLARVIVWCLQHFLLLQIHTYINLTFDDDDDGDEPNLPDPLTQSRKFSLVKETVVEEPMRYIPNSSSPIAYDPETFQWPPIMTVKESDDCCQQPKEDDGFSLENQLDKWFNRKQIRQILRIPAAKNREDLRNFVKMAPYFNGRHHMEEIMYHENVHRSHLQQLLDKFRDVLTRHEHEDPNLSMYTCNNC